MHHIVIGKNSLNISVGGLAHILDVAAVSEALPNLPAWERLYFVAGTIHS